MQITPKSVSQLAQLSLALEPILNKTDCTTRFVDLPEKPLADFLISAVNVGAVVEEYVNSVLNEKNKQVFSHFFEAVLISNKFKTKKYINVGLLEALFVTIKVRLTFSTLAEAAAGYIDVLKASPKEDFDAYTKAFELAWSTSKRPDKQAILKFMRDNSQAAVPSFYEWHALKKRISTDKASSDYQVTEQYIKGFPLIQDYIAGISESTGLLKSIENTYNELHERQPEIKVGVLADLSAAAIFLYLSYQDDLSYIIH